jgi:Holliday junction resolvase RusA-like endonuclease
MIKFEFKQFPTHAELTKTKSIKINGQSIYNARLHHFSRAKVILFMKKKFSKCIPDGIKINDFPIGIFIDVHMPYNYDRVILYKGHVKWAPMKDAENYTPKNDLDNFIGIWSKVIQDCIVNKKILKDDNLKYVSMLGYKYIPCETLDDRKIVVSLIPLRNIYSMLDTIDSSGILKLDDLEVLNSLLKF